MGISETDARRSRRYKAKLLGIRDRAAGYSLADFTLSDLPVLYRFMCEYQPSDECLNDAVRLLDSVDEAI